MTGEKDRYKTHEQLWKLEDGELSTPQHDELVLQLLNKKNAFKMLDAIGHINSWDFKLSIYNNVSEELKNILENTINESGETIKTDFIENLNTVTSPIMLSEVPIQSGYNKFIIGYIDVQFIVPIKAEWKIDTGVTGRTVLETEFPIFNTLTAYNNPLDMQYTKGVCCDGFGTEYPIINTKLENMGRKYGIEWTEQIIINIEVKPKIKSFGETLRQINTYREVFPDAVYVIYSPDTRFKAAFESQGVEFITPSDIGINM